MKNKKKGLNYAKYGYLFIIPFVVAFLLFHFYPTIRTVLLSFTDCKGLGNNNLHFLTEDLFKNYRTILNNKTFKLSLANTAIIWIMNFIPQIVFALLFTKWFTSNRNKIRGQGFFKVVFYLPNIITAATIAILFNCIFAYPKGPINDLLISTGLRADAYYFTNMPWASRIIVSFIQFWMWYGYTMIILISGVLGINPEIFEAAEIDGAGDWQTFFHITIPNLRSILTYTLVTSLMGGLTMYDIPKMFNNGNPANATLTTSVFIYNQAFAGSYMYARASAASMLLFLLIGVCSIFVFLMMRDKKPQKLKVVETKAKQM